jgi:hypothetical protein
MSVSAKRALTLAASRNSPVGAMLPFLRMSSTRPIRALSALSVARCGWTCTAGTSP